MVKSRQRQENVKRKKRLEAGIIIETKVSPIRRFIEILITLFFIGTILFIFLSSIDNIFTVITRHHLFPFFEMTGYNIAFWGTMASLGIVFLYSLFFIFSTLWLRVKRRFFDPKEHPIVEPAPVRDTEMAEWFQIPIEEVRRRQAADELIIYENIDNDRMLFLRAEQEKRAEEKHRREAERKQAMKEKQESIRSDGK